jgi:hypothetical protein
MRKVTIQYHLSDRFENSQDHKFANSCQCCWKDYDVLPEYVPQNGDYIYFDEWKQIIEQALDHEFVVVRRWWFADNKDGIPTINLDLEPIWFYNEQLKLNK